MSDPRADLDQQIAELEADLQQQLSPSSKRRLAAELADLRAQRAALAPPAASIHGSVAVDGDARSYGVTAGVIQGTVQLFFGSATPAAAGATLLADYLAALARDCDELRLSRLTGRRQTGAERGTAPRLRLQDVYTSLTTEYTT